MKSFYEGALADLQEFVASGRKYSHAYAVAEFEPYAGLQTAFARLISEQEFPAILQEVRRSADLVPTERRARGLEAVRRIAVLIKDNFGAFICQELDQSPKYRGAFLLLLDLHREFGDDFDGFVQFLADAISANASDRDFASYRSIVELLELLPGALSRFRSSAKSEMGSESEPTGLKIPQEIVEILRRLGSGQALSADSIKGALKSMGLDLGGRPGRTPKDYSAEYSLKQEGLSWTAVARQALQHRADLQQEHGTSDFDSLPLEERLQLVSRVRQGVRTYAKRQNKIHPPFRKALPSPRD